MIITMMITETIKIIKDISVAKLLPVISRTIRILTLMIMTLLVKNGNENSYYDYDY